MYKKLKKQYDKACKQMYVENTYPFAKHGPYATIIQQKVMHSFGKISITGIPINAFS